MITPEPVGELEALKACAARRRTARRQVADAVADYGSRSPEAVELRRVLGTVNQEWADLIRRAASHEDALAEIARAAGVAAPSLYYRLRQPTVGGRSSTADDLPGAERAT